MTMRAARTKVLGLVTAMVAGLLAVVTPATTAQAGSVTGAPRMTGYQVRMFVRGKHVGPNRFTYGGIKTINSFTLVRTTAKGGKWYRANTSVSGSCTACMAPVSPMSPNVRQTVRAAAVQASPIYLSGEWWNPTSWDWGSIFGFVWDRVKMCLAGALAGTVGTASGTLIVNLIARGGKVFVGPYGYAAIAVGGCFWSAVSGG